MRQASLRTKIYHVPDLDPKVSVDGNLDYTVISTSVSSPHGDCIKTGRLTQHLRDNRQYHAPSRSIVEDLSQFPYSLWPYVLDLTEWGDIIHNVSLDQYT